MGRAHLHRLLLALPLCVMSSMIHGQATGFNLVVQEVYRLRSSGGFAEKGLSIGIGFQRDFQQRIGMGLDVSYSPEAGDDGQQAFDVMYSSKYFTSENAATAFYLGPYIGYQRVMAYVNESSSSTVWPYVSSSKRVDLERVQVPIGLRAGVRGGLSGYFAEAFITAGYNIGHGDLYNGSAGKLATAPWTLSFGFSFLGFGWE